MAYASWDTPTHLPAEPRKGRISDLAYDKSAVFSSCRDYRYVLKRIWAEDVELAKLAVFIGLNPSTADETVDDPTVRRCFTYAHDWGCPGMIMLNIFAVRATDPKVMLAHESPIGKSNDQWLVEMTTGKEIVVACWGAHGTHMRRGEEVCRLLRHRELKHFGLTKQGQPRHPLYLAKDLKPTPWLTSAT